jgi:hypothetical protein
MPAGNRALSGLVTQHETISVNDEGILLQHQLREAPVAGSNGASGKNRYASREMIRSNMQVC